MTNSKNAQDDGIIVFDKGGRKRVIPRETYRASVLPQNLRAHWNDPEVLYQMLVYALNDGFFAEALPGAERLCAIDRSARAATLYAVSLMKCSRLEEAEHTLVAAIERFGADDSLLTNLAKIYAERGEHAKAEATLWRSLEIDPNEENSFKWYEVIYRERGGETASRAALERIAALPGSWKAQLFQARAALTAGDYATADALYATALVRCGKPCPAMLLVQIGGDLGNAGRLAEAVALVEPLYDVAWHSRSPGGFTIGLNLMRGFVGLGRLDDAERILKSMYSLERPDWREPLDRCFEDLVAERKEQRSGA